jgi:ABC-type microcin C transport system permease subunit YejE
VPDDINPASSERRSSVSHMYCCFINRERASNVVWHVYGLLLPVLKALMAQSVSAHGGTKEVRLLFSKFVKTWLALPVFLAIKLYLYSLTVGVLSLALAIKHL